MTVEASLITELRSKARKLDGQHALSLAAGVLHDAVNDGRTASPDSPDSDERYRAAQVAAALGAARTAAFGSVERDPDWTPSAA